jgi:hypothetical protein
VGKADLEGWAGRDDLNEWLSKITQEMSMSIKRTWLSKTFVEWPDPANIGKPWLSRRYRAVGVRSDGAVFHSLAFISSSQLERLDYDAVALAQDEAYRYLDRYLNADLNGEKAP